MIIQDLIKETYETEDSLLTLNGYFVFATDGSDFILPSTPSSKETYGIAKTLAELKWQ